MDIKNKNIIDPIWNIIEHTIITSPISHNINQFIELNFTHKEYPNMEYKYLNYLSNEIISITDRIMSNNIINKYKFVRYFKYINYLPIKLQYFHINSAILCKTQIFDKLPFNLKELLLDYVIIKIQNLPPLLEKIAITNYMSLQSIYFPYINLQFLQLNMLNFYKIYHYNSYILQNIQNIQKLKWICINSHRYDGNLYEYHELKNIYSTDLLNSINILITKHFHDNRNINTNNILYKLI